MSNKVCNDKKGDDKYIHLFISFVIGGVLSGLFSVIKFPHAIWASVLVFSIVMLIGTAKEFYDSRKPNNHFCVWDLLYDGYGAVAASIIAYFANYYTWN